MKPQDHIPVIQATATLMLPGMRHARGLLDISIRVLEYFERHAARDAATGTATAFTPADPILRAEVANLKAMLRTFDHLHEKRS